MEKLEFLKGVSIFSKLKPSQLKKFAGIMEEEKHEEGAIIFNESDPGDKLYVVCSGVVEVKKTVPLENGKEGVRLARFGKGEIFGEMAFFDNQPRSATALAYLKTELLVLKKDKLAKLFEADPSLEATCSREILREVIARLRGADETIRDLTRNLLYF